MLWLLGSYLGLGIIAGIMSGMFGIGGGIVIVPALILFYQFAPATANGTSLAALLMPVGILAVIQYYRAGLIQVKTALLIALGIVTGVVFGSFGAIKLEPAMLKTIYGFFLLMVSNNFLRLTDLFRKHTKQDGVPQSADFRDNSPKDGLAALLLGIVAGVLAGFFGIGGGIIIVPFLTLFFKFPYKLAVGTSLLALLFPVGLPGVLVYYHAQSLSLTAALLIGVGLFLGAFAGAKITLRLPAVTVRRIYGIFLILVALDFISKR